MELFSSVGQFHFRFHFLHKKTSMLYHKSSFAQSLIKTFIPLDACHRYLHLTLLSHLHTNLAKPIRIDYNLSGDWKTKY